MSIHLIAGRDSVEKTKDVVLTTTNGALNVTTVGGGGGGDASETTLATRLSEADFDAKTGSLTETAPATDTASSGLQRAASADSSATHHPRHRHRAGRRIRKDRQGDR